MNLKRILAVILAGLMLVAVVSCGNNPSGDTETTPSAVQSTSSAGPAETQPQLDEWGREIEAPALPENLKFTGETLKILSRSDASGRWQIDFYAKEENGVVLNDAVFRRNERVKDKLGISIEVTERSGSYTDFDSNYAPFITNAYNSGDGSIDLVGTYSLYGAKYATNGYFANVNELSNYLDLGRVWWNQNLVNDMTINDQLFFVVGDINITTLTRMLVTFFNKNLMKDKYADVDLYKAVIDGKWTIDYFAELTHDVWSDTNGNGKADAGDVFGILTTSPSEAYDGFAVSLDIPVFVKDGEGNWMLNENQERLVSAVEKTVNLYFKGTSPSLFTNLDEVQNAFASDLAYFMLITLDKATESRLTSMSSDYGIIPNAKLDEDQENYYTIPQDAFNLISVMGNVSNPDMVAAALQLLCAETYSTVTPAYFEVVLKYRYTRDNESGQMLDICRNGLRMDFATINTLSLNSAGHCFRGIMEGGKDNAGSGASAKIRANFKTYSKGLDSLISNYGAK